MDELNSDLVNFNIDELADEDDEEILEFTQEKEFLSHDEVYKASQEEGKKSIPLLSKYERARLIGIRKQQLSTGSAPCVKGSFSSIDEIVEEELKQKTLPLMIRREIANGEFEDWRIEDFQNI